MLLIVSRNAVAGRSGMDDLIRSHVPFPMVGWGEGFGRSDLEFDASDLDDERVERLRNDLVTATGDQSITVTVL